MEMKKFLLASSAALVLAACGNGGGGPAASPEDIDAALTQLSLRDSGSGRVEFEDRAESGNEVVFRNVVIDGSDFDDGDAEVDASLSGDSAGVSINGSGDLHITEMIFTGLNLDDEGRANFSHLVANALQIVPPEDEDAEGTFTIEKFELDSPSPELAAWLGGFFGQAEEAELLSAENVSFGELEFSGIQMVGSSDDGDNVSASIASVFVDNFGPEEIGEFSINGIDFNFQDGDEAGTFSLGKLSVGGVNGELLQALSSAGEDEESSTNLLSMLYANPMDPGFNEFSLEDLNIDAVGLLVALDDLSYDVSRNSDGVPTRFAMPEFTLTIDADAEGGEAGAQFAPVLAMIGMERLVISGEGTSTYDPETDISTTESSSFSIENAFTFTSTGEIGGISQMAAALEGMDPEAFVNGEQDPQAMVMEMYSQLDFHEMSFTIKDEGLLDKVFAILGPQQGMTAEDMRSMAVGMTAMLPGMAGQFGVDPAMASELSQALNAFLSGEEDELTITFDPETSFTLVDLMSDPTQLNQERLGFSAVAE